MDYIGSYRSEQSEAKRHVFQLDAITYLVVKEFGNPGPRTVKIWDLEYASLEHTVSKWSTNIEFQPTEEEQAAAEEAAVQLVGRAIDSLYLVDNVAPPEADGGWPDPVDSYGISSMKVAGKEKAE